MSDSQAQVTGLEKAYDQLPYESFPYFQTKVENLKTIAKIFGVNAPKLETARVLELGCASGGNLIPHAIHYPKAKFVGVDLSKVQTDIGNAQIKELGIKNIEIKNLSITDLDKSFGEFDYIICHSVISLVPDNVRKAIFDLCGKLLSPAGVAYISYNTLPGWNMVRSIRDMMLYHAQAFQNIGDQIQQSRLLLEFIKDSLDGMNSPYGEMLKAEAQLLATQPDYYLRHDHMGENNHQYYFHEFMQEANQHGLQYLGDANLASMYIGNLPAKVIEKFQEIKDIVRSEQYMDFITNRRFRATLLCKNNVVLNREISNDSIKDLGFSMRVVPEKALSGVKLDDNSDLAFFYNNDKENKLNTTSPILKAMLYVFSENLNYALSIDELVKAVLGKLPKSKISEDAVKTDMLANLMRLVFSGHVVPCTEISSFAREVSKTPEVSNYTRLQLGWNRGQWVTNALHDRVGINILDNYILRYLDGKHSEAQILDKLVEHVKAGELSLNKKEEKITDEKEMKKELEPFLKASLQGYAQNALLIK